MVIGKKYYADDAFLTDLLTKMEANDEYILNNAQEVTDLLKNNASKMAQNTKFTKNILSRCNINTVRGVDAKAILDATYPVYGLSAPDLKFYL